jgi:hypothetical protein
MPKEKSGCMIALATSVFDWLLSESKLHVLITE